MTGADVVCMTMGKWQRALRDAAKRIALPVALCLLATACAAPTTVRPSNPAVPTPVAFVTAQPPPRPQPTTTLPPLATATLPPPTVVPKRLPIDTTSAIGAWEDAVATANGNRVIDVAVGEGAAALKQRNPTLIALAQRQVYFGYSGTLTQVRSTKPQWLLYDAKGAVALASENREPLLNVRDPEVRAQLADGAMLQLREAGLDGIILDGMGNDLIRTDASPVFTGTRTFTEGQRKDAVEGLLRVMRSRLPDKLLIVGGYAWKDGSVFANRTNESLELANLVDGVYIGEFLRTPTARGFRTETDWKKDIDFLGAASDGGRIVLAHTRVVTASMSADAARQWLQYSVASFLVGKSGSRAYLQFDASTNPELADDPLLAAPVGAPVEAYSKSTSGIYLRRFSNGLVLVNATAESKKLDIDGEYRTLSGAKVDKTVTMTGNTGLILLKP